MLEDYEEGYLSIKTRKRWWHFWLPRFVSYGYYYRIGNHIEVLLMPNVFAGLKLKGEINQPQDKERA